MQERKIQVGSVLYASVILLIVDCRLRRFVRQLQARWESLLR